MSLFATPAEHAANPPETWTVRKRGDRWAVECAPNVVLDTYRTKRDATEATRSGRWVTLYRDEARWYAGETVRGWRSYAECQAETEAIRKRWPQTTTSREG